MANIVTKNAFTGKINIDTSSVFVQTKLNSFIEQTENSIIASLFGENAISWMNTEMLNETISNELKSFRDGGTFVYSDGKTYSFRGLVTILATFIYFDYIQDFTFNTPIGQVANDANQGSLCVDRKRICSIYNDNVSESIKLHMYVETYPTFFQSDIEQKFLGTVNYLDI